MDDPYSRSRQLLADLERRLDSLERQVHELEVSASARAIFLDAAWCVIEEERAA